LVRPEKRRIDEFTTEELRDYYKHLGKQLHKGLRNVAVLADGCQRNIDQVDWYEAEASWLLKHPGRLGQLVNASTQTEEDGAKEKDESGASGEDAADDTEEEELALGSGQLSPLATSQLGEFFLNSEVPSDLQATFLEAQPAVDEAALPLPEEQKKNTDAAVCGPISAPQDLQPTKPPATDSVTPAVALKAPTQPGKEKEADSRGARTEQAKGPLPVAVAVKVKAPPKKVAKTSKPAEPTLGKIPKDPTMVGECLEKEKAASTSAEEEREARWQHKLEKRIRKGQELEHAKRAEGQLKDNKAVLKKKLAKELKKAAKERDQILSDSDVPIKRRRLKAGDGAGSD